MSAHTPLSDGALQALYSGLEIPNQAAIDSLKQEVGVTGDDLSVGELIRRVWAKRGTKPKGFA